MLLSLAPACATGVPLSAIADEINATLATSPFVVAPGDTIDVKFLRKPEWNHIVRVRADGRTTFQGIGEITVEGLTMPELERKLTEAYQRTPEKPEEVSVNLGELGDAAAWSRSAVVMGEVTTPGRVDLYGERVTLVEAIGRAGGPIKATADLANTILARRLPDGRRVAWNIDARVDHWAGKPVYLQPHDIIFVHNTPIDDLDIWVDQWIRQLLPLPVGFAILPE